MNQKEQNLTFKSLFLPFTTKKAIVYIVIIGLIVYFNSLFNGFVGDDWGQIVDNVNVHSLSNIFYLFTSSTFYVHGAGTFGLYYKPIMMTLFSLIYSVFGSQAFIYHLTQMILHIVNSCLLFLFFAKFFGKKVSFSLAALFLIHPINSESVLYIANMQEVLFFFFGIISLLVLQKNVKPKIYLLIGIFGMLSLLSKETGILFILISLVYTYLFKNNKLHYYFTAGVTLITYLLLRISAIGIHIQSQETYLLSNSSFVERLISIPKIIFFYLSTSFFPENIVTQQHWVVRALTLNEFYAPLIFDILFFSIIIYFAFFFYLRGKKIFRLFTFFFIWFLLGLGFHSQLITLDATVSDRWFYFPIVGLLGMFGIIATYFWPAIKKIKLAKASILIFIILFSILSLRSFTRTFDWRNDYSLCSHDAKVNKNSYVLELCLGNEYRKLKNYNLAINHLNKSISLFPKYYIAMYYLAMTYADQRDYYNAIKYYEETVNNNNWGYGADMLATLLVYHKTPEQAEQVASENLKKQPNNGQLWYALSLAEYKLGNKEEALIDAQNAYSLAPNNLTGSVLNALQNNIPIKFNNK